jgi:asparagine synthase (glutamine-hydrolysing)
MCGIAGMLPAANLGPDVVREAAARMASALAHRGPDGSGLFADPGSGAILVHTRLSILDLSDSAAQPMASQNARWCVAFNGEIYNFADLRRAVDAAVPGITWASSGDTEALVEAIAAFGFEGAVRMANGMFAIAAWDTRERCLWLARDRAGEKPLYCGWVRGSFIFASELKALVDVPGFDRRLDEVAARHALSFGYVPGPFSIYQGIERLPPGTMMRVRIGDVPGAPRPARYWDPPRPAAGADAPDDRAFEALIAESVRLRMRSDVPMGAFLSGGIDSSTIVALMQHQSTRPVRTFSIGFEDSGFDESAHAAEVARALGTDHERLVATADRALAVVPRLSHLYDEPFADASQIPTVLLAELARPHVTVALSGDGGDELFGGYARYLAFDAVWGRIRSIPGPLRRPVARLAAGAARAATLPRSGMIALASPGRLRRLSQSLDAETAHGFYERILVARPRTAQASERAILLDTVDIERDFAHPVLGMSFVDFGQYLPDDVLVKVDRATMAVGLEARVPFLDHRLVEAAATLPLDRRIAGGRGKLVLRRILDRLLPGIDFDRPKQGFSPPIGAWLKADLRDWADDLLGRRTGPVGALLAWDSIDREWRAHVSGRADQSAGLWPVLMMLAWEARWKPS